MGAILKLGLGLAFLLTGSAQAHSQKVTPDQTKASVSNGASALASSIPAVPDPTVGASHRGATRFATRFEGDHSLEATTVVEQAFARYTLYTLCLKFTSGREQSLAVAAPPGGLQPEMRDMSGDSVPNDLVLTSKLFRSPLVVLLNDGHDHLTVAISPSSFAPGEGRASGPQELHRALALACPSSKGKVFATQEGVLFLQLRQSLLSPDAEIRMNPALGACSSGRAPPAHIAVIQVAISESLIRS